ncbi:hypothetical protein CC78DRAFT_305917 [Lojkania enalia]|uniref:Uncharacterized protein n=1 Tax=Lojkania enalia TaxID=147567 RepID=A0A9P4N9N9_9PLEO|nr:hypothetical protein CC78DRAFT_305917 [Didymosphaeria enalia]
MHSIICSSHLRLRTSKTSLVISSHTLILDSQSTETSSRQATSRTGFTPVAIAGILTAICCLLILVCATGFILRRYKKKQYQKMLEAATASKTGRNNAASTKGSVRTNYSRSPRIGSGK